MAADAEMSLSQLEIMIKYDKEHEVASLVDESQQNGHVNCTFRSELLRD